MILATLEKTEGGGKKRRKTNFPSSKIKIKI
jgi:hypothetical protein